MNHFHFAFAGDARLQRAFAVDVDDANFFAERAALRGNRGAAHFDRADARRPSGLRRRSSPVAWRRPSTAMIARALGRSACVTRTPASSVVRPAALPAACGRRRRGHALQVDDVEHRAMRQRAPRAQVRRGDVHVRVDRSGAPFVLRRPHTAGIARTRRRARRRRARRPSGRPPCRRPCRGRARASRRPSPSAALPIRAFTAATIASRTSGSPRRRPASARPPRRSPSRTTPRIRTRARCQADQHGSAVRHARKVVDLRQHFVGRAHDRRVRLVGTLAEDHVDHFLDDADVGFFEEALLPGCRRPSVPGTPVVGSPDAVVTANRLPPSACRPGGILERRELDRADLLRRLLPGDRRPRRCRPSRW